MVRRALIVNAYAIGNWGDTAIIEGVIDSLRTAGFAEVTVAPVDWRTATAEWRQIGADHVVRPLLSFYDVPRVLGSARPLMLAHALWRMTRSRYVRWGSDAAMESYGNADLVVSAGGAYLGGSRPGPNIIKLGNIRRGVTSRRPTVIAPVTVNPFSGTVGRLLRWGLGGTTIYARDSPSVDLLSRIGLAARLAPDMALRAPSLRRIASATAAVDPRPPTGTIGWAPREYRREHGAWGTPALAERRTLEAVRAGMKESDLRLCFVPHVRVGTADDDASAVDRLLAEFTVDEQRRIEIAGPPTRLSDAVTRYAGLDVLITSRMHAAIFAMAVGTPAIAIGYEPKVQGVMAGLGLGDRVVATDRPPSSREITELIERLRDPAERSRTVDAFQRAQAAFPEFERGVAEAGAAAA
jgi:polysaccharide pyruvyl transferase WcaK-like protein